MSQESTCPDTINNTAVANIADALANEETATFEQERPIDTLGSLDRLLGQSFLPTPDREATAN